MCISSQYISRAPVTSLVCLFTVDRKRKEKEEARKRETEREREIRVRRKQGGVAETPPIKCSMEYEA